MTRNKKLAVLAVVSLCFAMLLAVSASAAKLTDIEKHWGKEYIEYGVEKGYISGFEDNTFRPDEKVTRAQFAKMINGAVNITSSASVSFDDVAKKDWFYTDIQKAQYAAYVLGYENKDGSFSFKPNNPITRQEAAVILSRIVLPSAKKAELSAFKDGKTIDSWAVNEVLMIAAKGYIKGDENSNFSPKGVLTRAAAAKLICEFVKNENIENGDYEIEKESTVSETLFTDDVVVDTQEAADIIFKNCRILGTLTVKSQGAAVSLENSAIANVENGDEEDIAVSADASSTVKTANVKYPVTLSGNGFGKLVLGGKNVSAGTVVISGKVGAVEVSDDATIKIKGTVETLTITDKSNLTIQSGTIKTLIVEKNAAGSNITLSSAATVEKAVNNADASYRGAGTIEEAVDNKNDVTYETAPIKGGSTDKEDTEGDADFFDDVTFKPAKSATGVAVNSDVEISFDKAVKDEDGKTLTDDYLEDKIVIGKTSSGGSPVKFDATVVSTKKIALDPKSNLAEGTKYYVIIPAGTFTYSDGSTNKKETISFTTVDEQKEESEGITITSSTPEDGVDEVKTDTEISIVFSKKLYKKGGTSVATASYIEDEFEIREDDDDGDKVSFTAEISSTARVVTLKPSSSLKPGTKYYVIIPSGRFADADNNSMSKKVIDFETESKLPVKITPENEATNVSSLPTIKFEFSEPLLTEDEDDIDEDYLFEEVIELRKTRSSGTKIEEFTVEMDENRMMFTVTPAEELDIGVKYYVILKAGKLIGENSEIENKKVESWFQVAGKMDPVVTPCAPEKNAPVSTSVEVSFSEELYIPATKEADRVKITPEYIIEKNVVTLKRSSTKIECDVSISSDGKTIILHPVDELDVNKKYTVTVTKNLLSSKSGTKNTSTYTTSFETNEVLVPSFYVGTSTELEDEDDDIAVTSSFTIKFNEDTLYNASGKELKKSYVADNVVRLYKGSKSDENLVDISITEFTGTTITIKPDRKLESETKYIIEVVGGTLTNSKKDENPGYTISFETEFIIDKDIETDPASSGKTGISTKFTPSFTFMSPLYKKGGGSNLSESVLEESFHITKGTKAPKTVDGEKIITNLVPAEVVVSDNNKVFTIVPEEDLEPNTKYYVYFVRGSLAYVDDSLPVSTKSVSFTTGAAEEVPECEYCGEEHESEEHECSKCGELGHGEDDEHCSKCGEYGHNIVRWCTICEVHDHGTNDHCPKCGELECEEEAWCDICESHAHNTDAHCDKCGELECDEDKWCENCQSHAHNTDAHCSKCGELECEQETWCENCQSHAHNTGDESCPNPGE